MPDADALAEHLRWWGLRHFQTESDYYAWQRQQLSAADLAALNRLVEDRRHSEADDEAFYDLAARADMMAVLFSQRYDYYLTVGPLVTRRIEPAATVLDFGCGVGILTTFYARRYPDRSFIGVDRSAASLALARTKAAALGLSNVRFESQLPTEPVDLVISTQSLLQFERDPGVPSESWTTFRRPNPSPHQAAFERTTGLGRRLDPLVTALKRDGRMILFEKARPLGRRIAFQRALASRSFHLLEEPFLVQYTTLEEPEEEGPFYVVTRRLAQNAVIQWDEAPSKAAGEAIYRTHGEAASRVRARLPQAMARRREVVRSLAWGSIDLELGTAGWLSYLAMVAEQGQTAIAVTSAGMRDQLEAELNDLVAMKQARLDGRLQAVVGTADAPQEHATAHTPLYENHTILAQAIWEELAPRSVLKSQTFREPDGREKHIEYGELPQLTYLYWANTFDQRQLVIVERARAGLLEQYYVELVAGERAATGQQ